MARTKPDVGYEPDKLLQQQAYLVYLRRLDSPKLRKHHIEVFSRLPPEHPWCQPRLPRWCGRAHYERRLWYKFTVDNYHFEGSFLDDFKRVANDLLSHKFTDKTQRTDLDLSRRMRDFSDYSMQTVLDMSMIRVEQMLHLFGYLVEASDETKRICLWELVNKHASDLIPFGKMTAKVVFARADLRIRSFRQFIADNAKMSWADFLEHHIHKFPGMTNAKFRMQRWKLRKKLGPVLVPYANKIEQSIALRKWNAQVKNGPGRHPRTTGLGFQDTKD